MISSRFIKKGSLFLVDQDLSQAAYKMMRERMGWEEYEAFVFLVLTFVFISK